ncbi:transcriptional repressor [Candidatus Methylopumilus rimovensis]|jgi:Fur family ferric uptake transcriptional regulator|uniref:Transcriptional repressor n=1 Tax=Candidatus Methylopumilus rimovensis TaxID=2588535 RepID=A0AAE6FTC2_9PROT|nr:Fur family transcriptional regulator [Candidatus Methylopumilus rimovensis]QDD13656.1 transcriptional repressor [Candidatus Methylopumilus rimovensis]
MNNSQTLFAQKKLRATSSRLIIVDVLLSHHQPLSHQDILKQLPQNFDRVTLYRNLNWLLKKGLIHRISGENRTWYFQLNHEFFNSQPRPRLTAKQKISTTNHLHAHFNCKSCGQIFCLDDIHPKLSHVLPAKFFAESIELTIKGKCSRCQ